MTERFYKPIIYLVKRHGSMKRAAKCLGVSHQLLFYWNRKKTMPDLWKVYLHKKYRVPYKYFFTHLEENIERPIRNT